MAFAMRLNREGSKPTLANIGFFNNVWSDPTGTMGATAGANNDDFSDTPPADTDSFVLDSNLYYNGTDPIPLDGAELINYTDDASTILADPLLPPHNGLVIPRWSSAAGLFADGSSTIRQFFRRLVELYGRPTSSSPLVGGADPTEAPSDDILGNSRDQDPDLGAFELSGIFIDGFESAATSLWSSSAP